jgi:membrane associated rhomboid family serine protease
MNFIQRFQIKFKMFPMTYSIFFFCLFLMILLSVNPFLGSAGFFDLVFSPGIGFMWSGMIWGFLTNAFAHLDLFHFIFNMFWLFIIGSRLELDMGRRKYLLLILGAAIFSSAAQILLVQNGAIGFSGVIFSFVGYELIKYLKPILPNRILRPTELIILLVWLVITIFLGAPFIAHGAHFGGLVFGILFGFFWRLGADNKKLILFTAIASILSVSASMYMPWSESWQQRADVREIQQLYRESLAGNTDSQYIIGSSMVYLDSNRPEGIRLLEESANKGNFEAMNALGWHFATASEPEYRNPQKGLEWAGKAAEASEFKLSHIIDTLAAAHARMGNWDEAVQYQEQAIKLLNETDFVIPDMAEGMEERLLKYQRQQPYTEF